MSSRVIWPAVLAAGLWAFPTAVLAHDAFGDLGPFYASLLHPLADPAQAVVVAGFAVLLARHSLPAVQRGFATFVVVVAGTILLAAWLALPPIGTLAPGILAALLGLAVLPGQRLPQILVIALGVGAAAVTALAFDSTGSVRDLLVLLLGGTLGLATATLLLWSLFDLLRRRIGDIACAVAGSWIAAIGIMTSVLPR